MSEIKTYKCDECRCHIASDGHGDILGLRVQGLIDIDVSKHPGHKTYKRQLGGLDFCNLQCMTTWIAYDITTHFIEHCGGEKE